MHGHKRVHELVRFAHTCMYDCSCTDLHARSQASVWVHACVCVENMWLSCLTSKMLAHSVVWDDMLTGCLWWTTIYNNVKLTRSSWCAAGRLFNMTHPDACFVQQSFVLLRAVLRINNNATFYLLPVGCSVAAYSTPIVSVLLGNISGQMLACVWSCSQGASVYMPAPSLDSETW